MHPLKRFLGSHGRAAPLDVHGQIMLEWRSPQPFLLGFVHPVDSKYGDVREKGACNDSGISPLHVYYPEAPSTYSQGPMNDPRLNQTPGTVALTGQFGGCTNGFGVFDMVGNMHEWVMSTRPTFRGGYYQDTHINGDGCAYHTTAHAAAYHDYSTGFRCCADPAR